MSFDIVKYPTLALIDSTQELRLLPEESLPKLCDELCRYLLDSVSRPSGCFAPGPDTVELVVTLHYVYNTPLNQLIWDMGHQTYPYKILTRRRDKIGTIHQRGGLRPFPWHGESEYDVLSIECSSTSISAGIDIAVAAEKEGKNHHTVYVIGDDAIITGMTSEAMNHTGDTRLDMLAVLNDNEMSISENIGALNNHLAQLLSGKLYFSLHEGGKEVFSDVLPIKKPLRRTEEYIKGTVMPDILFEELGFNYVGPIDDHDVLGLITMLKNIRDLKGPQFLHIMTKKGRDCEPAEEDLITFHTVPRFNPSSGCLLRSNGGLPSYSKIFGGWLCEMVAKNNKLVTVVPAMREGSDMVRLSRKFPDRCFDMAIAEQHTVTFVAGLAVGGYKPIVVIYSIFLQRAYDQVPHDVAIQKPPVLFAIDRTGIVSADGRTRQDALDLSYLRCISEMVTMAPSGEDEYRQMLYTSYHYNDGPFAVRCPRGNVIDMELTSLKKLPTGKGIMKCRGGKLTVLSFDTLIPETVKVAGSLNITLVGMRFVKLLDRVLILEMAASHEALVTAKKDAIMGGVGSGVNEVLIAHHKPIPVLNIGLPDFFIPRGIQEEMRAELGLGTAGMGTKIKAWLT